MSKNNYDPEFEKYKELFKNKEFEECQICGGSLELEKVNLEDYQEGKLYMMEKVPAYVCGQCGELWVPEPIMKEFEKMIELAKTRKHKITKEYKSTKGGRKEK